MQYHIHHKKPCANMPSNAEIEGKNNGKQGMEVSHGGGQHRVPW